MSYPRFAPTASYTHLDASWLDQLGNILSAGDMVAPRGQLTRELRHSAVHVNMRYPVLTVPERKLNYRFMAAEAYWIISGDDSVAGIAPWNRHISQFSDDGEVFAGAYGPRIKSQLEYVLAKLIDDPDTRQAVLTIWQPNPAPSKDIPCTVAMDFQLRPFAGADYTKAVARELNLSVYMRSSDVWLGLPYDVFNFSLLAHYVAALLNQSPAFKHRGHVTVGTLSLTAGSSHLYERNFEAAGDVLRAALLRGQVDSSAPTPFNLQEQPDLVLATLKNLRDTSPGDPLRWWSA